MVAVVVGVVLHVLLARRDQLPLARWIGGVQEALLGRGMAADLQRNVLSAARFSHADVETLILLFIDQLVLARLRADHMPVEPVLALGLFLFDGVENGLIIVGPSD